MSQITKISIASPCSQTFESFSPTANGGFCSMCQKEVIDFRNKTDKEVLHYFQTDHTKTCGYFRKEQLKTYESIPKDSNFLAKWKFGFASFSLFSLFTTNQVIAQSKEETPMHQTDAKNLLTEESKEEKIIVRGSVSDASGRMPGATIWLKNSDLTVSTGFDGTFQFPTPISKGSVIVVSFLGMETQEIIVTQERNIIVLKDLSTHCELMFAGEVLVEKVYRNKIPFFQKVKNWFLHE